MIAYQVDLFPEAAPPPDPLIGRAVTLDAPCCTCGSTAAIIRPGTGPHLGALHCRGCGIHRQWISRASFVAIGKFISEVVNQFGVEPAEIAVRQPAAAPQAVTRTTRHIIGREKILPRQNKSATANEPTPFNDPIGF